MKDTLSSLEIPASVSRVTEALEKAGREAYLVGGCVRDLVLGKAPRDWDVTTNARPEEIQGLFPDTFYENTYGTVGVVDKEGTDEASKVVEVTPYRTEGKYSDKRRPDGVSFSDRLEDDLKRRDFTINALALKIAPKGSKFSGELVDLYEGRKDLKNKVIRAVGAPLERFSEDALRIMRAVRLSAELGFEIEGHTLLAMKQNVPHLAQIARERIRDEFVRIVESDEPMKALELSRELGILPFIAPELGEGVGIEQNQAHAYDVWEHLLRTVQHSADKKYPTEVRLAALFHDIGKPATRRFSRETNQYTFYGHEVVGARMTEKILRNLGFPSKTIETVVKLVRWHMFFSDTEAITLSAVRRMVANVGKDRIWDLINVRVCDRIGTGRPKENPYRLRKYKSMIEEALRDPITVGMLAVNGADIMKLLGEAPGPKIGLILNALMEEVLEDPKLNKKETLEARIRELAKLGENELRQLAEAGKEKKEAAEEAELKEIRKKHGV